MACEKGLRKVGEGALFGAASGSTPTRPSVSDQGRESITQLSPTLQKPFGADRSRNGIYRGTLERVTGNKIQGSIAEEKRRKG
jgi:hypothetical protein